MSCEAIITCKNNSPDTLDRIFLHIYPNAFKNENSTFTKEAKRMFFGGSITLENKGYIDILEFKISRKDANITAVDAPIVACRADDTILKSKLPEALPPG